VAFQWFGAAVAAQRPIVSGESKDELAVRGKRRRHYQHGDAAGLTGFQHGGSGIAATVAGSE